MVLDHKISHTELTTQFPTREYLIKNFSKPDLQKRCRELGLTKIWVTKDQLFNMKIHNTQIINDSQINAHHDTYAVSALVAAALGAAVSPPLDAVVASPGPVAAPKEPVAAPKVSVVTPQTTQTSIAAPQASQASVSAP